MEFPIGTERIETYFSSVVLVSRTSSNLNLLNPFFYIDTLSSSTERTIKFRKPTAETKTGVTLERDLPKQNLQTEFHTLSNTKSSDEVTMIIRVQIRVNSSLNRAAQLCSWIIMVGTGQ